ncbi:MAG: D-alanyl-D-alanine carboxypeptidase [Comamonadaceae bacterium]|nr:D-alanyl-D-alanine carboxypeptidase [Comamonadaceae bacterium]
MLGWGIAAAAAALDDPLPAPVAAALARAGLPPDALGAIAIPRTRWARTWQHRADVPMQPGSTMKVVTTVGGARPPRAPTTAAAPSCARPDRSKASVLAGDLVLKGGADPDLDLPRCGACCSNCASAACATIGGDLVLDRTLFRPARIDLGVPPFDEAPE